MARPRTFDIDQVLDQAADVFVTQGFAAVGIDTLTAELGLSRSSIYAAFGSKQGLWLQVLRRYRSQALARVEAALKADNSLVLDALIAVVDATRASIEAGIDARCLVVVAACERGASDADTADQVAEQFIRLDVMIRQALQRAADRGELDPTVRVAGLASLVSTVISGARVKAASGDASDVGVRALAHVADMLRDARSPVPTAS